MPHATASVNGTVIAETDKFEYVEGNVYFPLSSVKDAAATLTDSSLHTTCPWKGQASYYNVQAGGKTYKDAAWYYPTPSAQAAQIKDHVAFSKSAVHVEKQSGNGEGGHGFMDKMKHMFKS